MTTQPYALAELRGQLDRCRQMMAEYHEGPTARNLHELELELLDQIRESKKVRPPQLATCFIS